MAKNEKRIEKTLQKYAQYLGDGLKDASGTKYDFGKETEARQKQQLFSVTNRDAEDTIPGLMLGHVIIDKIRDDAYDIEYIGLHRDAIAARKRVVEDGEIKFVFVDDDDLTKTQKDVKSRLQKLDKKIELAMEEGERLKAEREGLYA